MADDNTKVSSGDLVLGIMPNGWARATSEEKAVLALAPVMSFALLLDDGEGTFERVANADVARVLKALVDRAEVILGIPGRSVLGSIEIQGAAHA